MRMNCMALGYGSDAILHVRLTKSINFPRNASPRLRVTMEPLTLNVGPLSFPGNRFMTVSEESGSAAACGRTSQ